MPAPSAKQIVQEALKELPDNVTMEDMVDEMRILAALQRGEQAADEGRVLLHDEVSRLMPAWISK